ncbi:MAG TPA: response regulator [Thermoflexales bacterium]|nr:response regulator [Thermoflexales bacterium]
MNTMKILLVEDDKGEQETFKDSVAAFNRKFSQSVNVNYEVAGSSEEAKDKLNGSFDGMILDMKLKDDMEGGNKVAQALAEAFWPIPVIFVTSYPDMIRDCDVVLKKRARGDETYESDFQLFLKIKKTGISHILGGTGKIRQTLATVFFKNILPQLDIWQKYGDLDSDQTEEALLRHTLNHLLQLLDQNNAKPLYPEEFYLSPPLTDKIRTGSIIQRKEDKQFFVVLSPACDLVERSGEIKTNRVLIVEIDSKKVLRDENKEFEKPFEENSKILKNSHNLNHHFLPPISTFDGGFINFRKLQSLSLNSIREEFSSPQIQIASEFIKDIVSRFSQYYARQGQPEIDTKHILEILNR